MIYRLLSVLLPCLACTACLGISEPDCSEETRSLAVAARLGSTVSAPMPGDTGWAQLSLYEARNAKSKSTTAREVLWFVGAGVNRDDVTEVHVHEEATGRVLFTIPLAATQAPAYVITQIFTRQPYSGSVAWNEFYDLMGDERAYADVHTKAHPEGQLRGILRRDFSNWQSFTHAYCS